MIEALFAFAIAAGGYGDWCRDHPTECTPAIVKIAPGGVIQSRLGGQVTHGVNAVVIKDGYPVDGIQWRLIYVHEATHILQARSRRYMDRNPYERKALKEKEAYEVADRYLVSQGYKPLNSREPAELMAKAEAARARGLVK